MGIRSSLSEWMVIQSFEIRKDLDGCRLFSVALERSWLRRNQNQLRFLLFYHYWCIHRRAVFDVCWDYTTQYVRSFLVAASLHLSSYALARMVLESTTISKQHQCLAIDFSWYFSWKDLKTIPWNLIDCWKSMASRNALRTTAPWHHFIMEFLSIADGVWCWI